MFSLYSTSHIITPNVLKVWREQTGCTKDNDNGPTLEDIPMGVGSHWEARQTGKYLKRRRSTKCS